MIPVFHHPGYAAPLGEGHVMPMRKFALVAEALRGNDRADLRAPEPVAEADLRRVHREEYLEAVRTGQPRELAESQKFPWSPELFPSVRLTNGGMLAAARSALETGVAANLASGFHHAHERRGEGFCTFNGLVVALEALRAEGVIRTAAVLDLDVHYGNGTALLAEARPWLSVLSLYGSDFWNNRAYLDTQLQRHVDGQNHRSAVLPRGAAGADLMACLERELPWLVRDGVRPDVLLYQAGADPLRSDPYSPLDLGHDDLRERDRRVFEWARGHGIPLAWALAGGYTRELADVVRVHVNTFEAAVATYFA